ncbi:autotransporter outer membrane beta-barrel domain-containing protein [Enterobacter sp. H2G27]
MIPAGCRFRWKGGIPFLTGGTEQNTFFVQPQAQIVWNDVKMDEHRETNGTRVSGRGDNNVQSRVGVKGFMEHRSGKDSVWKPYLAANWIHNSEEAGVRMGDVTLYGAGQKDQVADLTELPSGFCRSS